MEIVVLGPQKGSKGHSTWVSVCEACAFHVLFFHQETLVVNSKPATLVLPSHEVVLWCPSELRCLFPLSDVSCLDLSLLTPYIF